MITIPSHENSRISIQSGDDFLINKILDLFFIIPLPDSFHLYMRYALQMMCKCLK